VNTGDKMSKTKEITITLIITIAVIVAGYFLFFQQQEKFTGPIEKLTIGSPHQEISSLVYLAKEQGCFEEVGLDLEIKEYLSGFASIQGLLDKEVDIALSTDFAFVSSHFDNNELRIFSSIAEADVEELIARKDSGIYKIEDLKGKKIGIKEKSSAEFHLATFLLFSGISLEEINIIDLTPPELVKAILNKEIDAVVIWPPQAYNLKKELREDAISWSAQCGQPFFWLALTTEPHINEKKSSLKKFLECLSKSEKFIQENEIQAKQIIIKYLDSDKAYMDYYWPKQNFTVELPQSLLFRLEDEARWRIKNILTDKTEVPNYFDFICTDALDQVKPSGVTIIR